MNPNEANEPTTDESPVTEPNADQPGRSDATDWSKTSRRSILKTVGAGAVLGAAGAANVAADVQSMEFVETDGTNFAIDGRPIYFNGTNNFWIADPYADRQRVDDFMDICDAMNLNLVRTWAFCSGDGGHCLQPEPGVYSEAGFQHLDYVIAKAREHGVRLVLPLVNNWDDYGGMAQYVSWSSTASSHDDFYVDDEAQSLYHDFVEYVLTRENTLTGVEYRNEPAIAIWELANEPRAKDASDGIARVTQWIQETTTLIKNLDSNHLVSTGMEGFYDKNPNGDWRHNGSHGTAFIDQHQIDGIDACTFHLYPNHWPGIDPTVPQDGVDWIVEHVGDAHDAVGKPVYLGEFGINTNANSQSVRDQAFQAYYNALDDHDADGAMVWEIVRDSQSNHDGYAVYQGESSTQYLNSFTDAQYEKSGGDGSANGSPFADATGPTTLRVGETGTFDASLSFDPEQSIASYDWDFSDGASGAGERVGHRYTATGSNAVDLTVTDAQGATDTDGEDVSVQDLPADSYLVEGAGETVENTTKEFHVAYVDVSGEFTLEAKVADLEPTAPDAQAGIMTLDDLSDPGPLGAVTITPGEGSELTRAYTDQVWRERTAEGRSPPLWLRLERTAVSGGGFEVTGSVSPDGNSWTEIQTGGVDMADQAYVGLYVSANDQGELCAAQFDGVTWLDGFRHADVGPIERSGYAAAGSGSADLTPPDAPTNLAATATTQTSVDLGWDASSDTGGSDLDHYAITVDGGQDHTVPAGTTSTTVSGLSAGTTYDLGVTAVDGAGNESVATTLTVTTESSSDSTAPTAPTNLSVSATTESSVSVGWSAATDAGGSGLDHYAVYLDGSQDQTVPAGTTAATVSGLSPDASYQIDVSAVDGAGNESSTTTVSATTDASNPPTNALVVNDYDGSPAWSSSQNDLGQWCGAGSFQNGGGSGEVVSGALDLQYDDGGWYQEQINRDVSSYSTLVLSVSGANGGEESEILFDMGGVRTLLANVTSDSVGTSTTDVEVDLEAAGVDRTASSLSLRLNFWQGGASTLSIEEVRLE